MPLPSRLVASWGYIEFGGRVEEDTRTDAADGEIASVMHALDYYDPAILRTLCR